MSSQESTTRKTLLGVGIGAAIGFVAARMLPKKWNPPKVWKQVATGSKWDKINSPTAGPRHEEALPDGKHDLQIYSKGTPNGVKVTCMLEELNQIDPSIEYDAYEMDIFCSKTSAEKAPQFSSGWVAVNPNSKIPCMVDKSVTGLDGKSPLRVFESASILLYLADKYGHFIPKDPAGRVECLNWVFWGQGEFPYIGGGFGHFFAYAPHKMEYPINRYTLEAKRVLSVLDRQLSDGRDYICGSQVTIADFCIFPWMYFPYFYGATEFLDFEKTYTHVVAWLDRMEERPACKRGIVVNAKGFRINSRKLKAAGIETGEGLADRHSREDFGAVGLSDTFDA